MEAALIAIAGVLIIAGAFALLLRRHARRIGDRAPGRMRVSPYDGSIEPNPGPGSTHDPSPSGLFDRSGVSRRE